MEQAEYTRHAIGMKEIYSRRKETTERVFADAKETNMVRSISFRTGFVYSLNGRELIPAVNIPRIYLVFHILKLVRHTVDDNDIRQFLEFLQIPNNPRPEKFLLLQ